MDLTEALLSIQYDASWGIWAELIDGKFTEESEWRYGQVCFENGGLLDSKVFLCGGEQIGNWLTSYGFKPDKSDVENDPHWIDAFLEQANETVSLPEDNPIY